MAAFGTIRATAGELQAVRQQFHPLTGTPFPPGTFRHTDEQTIAALLAVWQAVRDFGLESTDFTDWGVLAAPRFVGRVMMASALERFAVEGAWGISPHLIPHRSLHSVSGTISQMLHIHGPNFGIGGGPGSGSEALLAVPPLLGYERLPGLWCVLSGWQTEPVPQRAGAGHFPGSCTAVALALRPTSAGLGSFHLAIEPRAWEESAPGIPLDVENLYEALSPPGGPTAATWCLEGGGQVVLTRRGQARERRAG